MQDAVLMPSHTVVAQQAQQLLDAEGRQSEASVHRLCCSGKSSVESTIDRVLMLKSHKGTFSSILHSSKTIATNTLGAPRCFTPAGQEIDLQARIKCNAMAFALSDTRFIVGEVKTEGEIRMLRAHVFVVVDSEQTERGELISSSVVIEQDQAIDIGAFEGMITATGESVLLVGLHMMQSSGRGLVCSVCMVLLQNLSHPSSSSAAPAGLILNEGLGVWRISPDKRWCIFLTEHDAIELWQVETRDHQPTFVYKSSVPLESFELGDKIVLDAVWSADSKRVAVYATGAKAFVAGFCEVSPEEGLALISVAPKLYSSIVALLPAALQKSHTLAILDTARDLHYVHFISHEPNSPLLCVAELTIGRTGKDTRTFLISIDSQTATPTLFLPHQLIDPAYAITCGSDRIAVALRNSVVQEFDSCTGELLQCHVSASLLNLRYSANDELVGSTHEGQVCYYSKATRSDAPVTVPLSSVNQVPVDSALILADGTYFATIDHNCKLQVWTIDSILSSSAPTPAHSQSLVRQSNSFKAIGSFRLLRGSRNELLLADCAVPSEQRNAQTVEVAATRVRRMEDWSDLTPEELRTSWPSSSTSDAPSLPIFLPQSFSTVDSTFISDFVVALSTTLNARRQLLTAQMVDLLHLFEVQEAVPRVYCIELELLIFAEPRGGAHMLTIYSLVAQHVLQRIPILRTIQWLQYDSVRSRLYCGFGRLDLKMEQVEVYDLDAAAIAAATTASSTSSSSTASSSDALPWSTRTSGLLMPSSCDRPIARRKWSIPLPPDGTSDAPVRFGEEWILHFIRDTLSCQHLASGRIEWMMTIKVKIKIALHPDLTTIFCVQHAARTLVVHLLAEMQPVGMAQAPSSLPPTSGIVSSHSLALEMIRQPPRQYSFDPPALDDAAIFVHVHPM